MNGQSFRVEVVDPVQTRVIEVRGVVELGRESADIVVNDPAVSRVHLRLAAGDTGLTAEDMGSSNGSHLRGAPIRGIVALNPGDELRIGDTYVRVLATTTPTRGASAEPTEPVLSPTPSTSRTGPAHLPDPPDPPTPHPLPLPTHATTGPGHTSEALRNESVEVRYSPNTYGAAIAKSYAATAARARENLAGLGSEPWGTVPVVHLIDPYHDGTEMVASGSIVDAARGEAWVVVTAESPPEDPHRALALLFGAALPNAADLALLIEGFGLHRSGLGDPDSSLGAALPGLDDAQGDQRGPVSLSFVRFLISKEGEEGVLRLLGAPEGRVDEVVREVYGAALGQLELAWRRKVVAGEPDVKTGEFLRLSLKYLRPYRLRQLEVFGYMLLSLAFVAAFPFVTRRLFDTALPSGEFSQVLTLLIGLGIAFVVSLIAGVRQAYQTAWISGAVTRDIRQSIFDRVQKLPATWYREHPQGDVLSRLFSDVGVVEEGLSSAIGQGIFQMISLITSTIIMLTINFQLGLIVLVAAPLVGVVYRRMSAGARDRSLALQEDNSALLSVAAENYQASPVVKMFGLAAREERRFGQQGDRLFRSMRRLQLWGGLFGMSVNLIVTALRLTVLGFGAWLILEGRFTTGGLVAFLSIMGEVLSPVTVLVGLSQDVQQSMGSLVRINDVMEADTEPERDDLPPLNPVRREVRLAGVGLSYTPERRAVDDFDVTIPVGSRVAFVGPSGSGKSTVLRLLMRMYEPDEGAILIDGVDLRARSLRSWRDQVGVVFQDSFLFDATLRENIALGRPGATDADIDQAAAAAEVDTFVDSLPNGYNSLVGEGGSNLSGGQRQRVAIARALVRNPQVLLLDEATSALDPATERQINDTIERVAAGRTVIAVTHRLASITDYDRIFVIVDGRLAEDGKHSELIAAGGVYAGLWAEQTGQPMPDQPEFDAAAALRRVPFLTQVSDATLTALVAALDPFSLEAGSSLDEGDSLVLVKHGEGEIVAGGRATAMLTPGEAFGVGAALGVPSNTSLRAAETMELLALPAAALADAAQGDPMLLDALEGHSDGPRPTPGGTRLTRLTLAGPVPAMAAAPGAPVRQARPTSVGRATGAFPRVG